MSIICHLTPHSINNQNKQHKPKLNKSPLTCPGLACHHDYTQPTDKNIKPSRKKSERKEMLAPLITQPTHHSNITMLKGRFLLKSLKGQINDDS